MSEIPKKINLDDTIYEIVVNVIIIKIIWGLLSFGASSVANLVPIQAKVNTVKPELINSKVRASRLTYSIKENLLNLDAWALDIQFLIDHLDNLKPGEAWGFCSSIIVFYFEFLNSELKYFYDNLDSEQDLSQNLVIGARLLMSGQFEQSNAVSLGEFTKASNLINQGGRKSHKYSKLCKELMAIVQTRIKLEAKFGYSSEMIEQGLARLQDICDRDGLIMPNNVLLLEQEDGGKIELKNPSKRLSFGQVISLLFIAGMLAIIAYYIVKY